MENLLKSKADIIFQLSEIWDGKELSFSRRKESNSSLSFKLKSMALSERRGGVFCDRQRPAEASGPQRSFQTEDLDPSSEVTGLRQGDRQKETFK